MSASSRRPEPWPSRPSIPPTLILFLGVLVPARLLLWARTPAEAAALGPSGLWWAGAIGAILALSALALLGERRRRGRDGRGGSPGGRRWLALGALGAVAVTLGCAVAVGSLEGQRRTAELLGSRAVSSLSLRAERDATPTDRGGWWFSARVLDGERAVGTVWVSSPAKAFAGDVVRGTGRFEPNGEDDFGVSSRMRSVAGTVSLVGEPEATPRGGPLGLLGAVRRALIDAIDPTADPGRALVAGAALGCRDGLKAFGLDDAFSRAGLSHLVAVSGLHVALATSLAGAVALRLRWPRGVRMGCLALWGAAYVALCDAPASALRSLAMAGAAQGSDLAGRRAYGLGAVGVVGLAMVLLDGGCAGDLGFLLSATCVVALGLFSRWADHGLATLVGEPRLGRLGRRLRRRVLAALRTARGTLAASLVCLAASLPLVAATYGSVSLLSPISGVLLTPVFEGFLTLALGAALLAWIPLVGPVVLAAVAVLGGGLGWAVGLFGALPWGQSSVAVPEPWATLAFPLGALALYLLWPRPGRREVAAACATLACACFGWWVVRPMLLPPRVVVLDVGQGDAILVQDGLHAALVDTGPDDSVVRALARQGVARLDAVLLTHQHADHAGGLASLQGFVAVGRLYVPEGQAAALGEGVGEAAGRLGCAVTEVRRGDRLHIGRLLLTILWPEGPEDGDENDESLVARLDCADGAARLRALLTGDAESDVLDELVRRNEVGDLDLLKVGHHGSAVSVDEGAVERCSPEVAVASAGEGNSYGHPTRECIDILEGAGSLFLCTKDVGDVEVRPGATGPVVSVQRAPAGGRGG